MTAPDTPGWAAALGRGLPGHWSALTRIAAGMAGGVAEAERESERLVARFRAHGHLPDRLLGQAIAGDLLAGVLFFNRLYREAGLSGERPPSPVAGEPDPRWMTRADYCFVNARATGRRTGETGNFVDATRLLPILRARAVHLAPFFQSVFGVVYAQDSTAIIDDRVTHAGLEAGGLGRADQLRYFVDCCHLLGKAVAFDLTAHTSGFSKVSLDHPALFRWLRFDGGYDGLRGGATVDEQVDEAAQAAFAAHIAGVVGEVCRAHGLSRLDADDVAPARADAAHAAAKQAVRALGYYPVVPHTWNGVGLPGLRSYDKQGHYPVWDYRDAEGRDQSAHGIGIHASFKLHVGLAPNRPPPPGAATPSWDPSVDYLAGLFPRMHRDYGFDFLRVDYVDHAFRGVSGEGGQERVTCEQISPRQLAAIASAARAAFPPAGMLADHVGNDIDRYREAGFQVILGREVQYPLCKDNLLEMLHFNHELAERHRADPAWGTAAFPIDTHDMGHPALLGADLAEREERALVLLRHFVSRFGTAGLGMRPKYETLGAQDRSTGLYRANNAAESLAWGEDRAALAAYHAVEDAFEAVRGEWLEGEVDASYVHDDTCWWRVTAPSRRVTFAVLTWFGDRYDLAGAPGARVREVIPITAPVAVVEPVLGIRPGRDPGDTEVRLDPHHLECQAGGGALEVRWPRLSSWVLRLRHDG